MITMLEAAAKRALELGITADAIRNHEENLPFALDDLLRWNPEYQRAYDAWLKAFDELVALGGRICGGVSEQSP